jgi:hypothetical protein
MRTSKWKCDIRGRPDSGVIQDESSLYFIYVLASQYSSVWTLDVAFYGLFVLPAYYLKYIFLLCFDLVGRIEFDDSLVVNVIFLISKLKSLCSGRPGE